MTLDEATQLISTPNLKTRTPQRWADLGCGAGLFTQALVNLLPAQSLVYAIDSRPQHIVAKNIGFIEADFENDILPLPLLDGILLANSLHFIKDKPALLVNLKKLLKPQANFIVVEYDTESAHEWVPFPIGFSLVGHLFKEAGFTKVEKIGERLSIYDRAKIYAAYLSK